ncbi:protein-methionine-sulfoxide reductase heme-binding subunit MsrQ [Aestuariibacter salexigens]|uniref:protein-methionine-sulfoxide reductase heme-binding subunit MsrQ n=1 Tax=Aestuariibacter salexigens TaxID=226010 RepID=UPI00041169AB|nr:protein-methionine-sulfoxide reductase heme-binding subunit MsrQ [Aestuariibacter salexigens]
MVWIRLTNRRVIALKSLIHIIAGLWLVQTFYAAISDQLAGDPVEILLHFTGIGALNLLLLSLSLTPLAKWQRQGSWIALRRLTGLWSFTYALCHFLVFILFELQLEWQLVASEIIQRPYITVGFSALLILTALAITSISVLRRRMGRSWQKLHNTVYIAVLLIMLHFTWSLKTLELQILIYAIITGTLLWFRRNKLAGFLIKK